MRKAFPLLLLFLFFSSFSPSVPSEANTLSKVDRLALTCKVWGFLKYYHPKVGTGVYDWDDKLIKVLQNTSNITTYDQLDTYMSRWIYAFGPRKPCQQCKRRNSAPFQKNFDLSWTQSSRFSSELRATFKDIEKNRFQGAHHYVEMGKAGQFMPKSESGYYDLNLSDENYRLLPLFRYWNYIEYFFPYKYQTDQDWDEVLLEMIPVFLAAQNKLDFHKAMLELTVRADDSHAGLVTKTLDQMPYYNYLPAKIEMVENSAIVTEIIDPDKAREANLQVGDVITSVNGRPTKAVHQSHARYVWGSNEAVKERSVYHTLFMGLQDQVNVTIDRNGIIRSDQLNLYSYAEISYSKSAPKAKWSIPRDSVGYIDLDRLESNEVQNIMGELMDTKVLIIDIRNAPKGTYRALANYLKPSSSVFARFVKPDFSYPGMFTWAGESSCGAENEDYYRGQVILLVNATTQGHGEFTCMCLQTAPDVVTVGSQTAGTNGAVSRFALIQNLNTQFSGTGIFYPDQSEVQRVGVRLDHEVTPTIAGIRNGEDEVMSKALELAEERLQLLKADYRLRLDSLGAALRSDSLLMDSVNAVPIELDTLRVGNGYE